MTTPQLKHIQTRSNMLKHTVSVQYNSSNDIFEASAHIYMSDRRPFRPNQEVGLVTLTGVLHYATALVGSCRQEADGIFMSLYLPSFVSDQKNRSFLTFSQGHTSTEKHGKPSSKDPVSPIEIEDYTLLHHRYVSKASNLGRNVTESGAYQD